MDGMTRREVLGTLGAAAGACLLSGPFAAAQTARPNIIFILADDLGYGDLSCYGQQRFQTPNIDRLAIEGMKFTAHYSGHNVCAPSRCVLMTGKHPGHAFIRDNRGGLGPGSGSANQRWAARITPGFSSTATQDKRRRLSMNLVIAAAPRPSCTAVPPRQAFSGSSSIHAIMRCTYSSSMSLGRAMRMLP